METKRVILSNVKFQTALKNLWCDCQQQKNSYDQLYLWWEIEKRYLKMLAIDYCVETKKNKRKKQEELSKYRENETKPRPKQNKQITKSPTRYTKL